MTHVAWAHPEAHERIGPSFWTHWTPDPLVLSTLLVVAAAYVTGAVRLRRRGARRATVGRWQLGAMALGWSSIVVSLLSPLDWLSDASFAAHMTQHEILMLVAAPLLVLGRPLVVLLWALPASERQRIGRWVTHDVFVRGWRLLTAPLTTLIVHGLAIWVWHVPRLFDAALENEAVHAVQHLCFFLSAALFWWAIAHGRYGRVGYGVSVLFVFATALHQSALGALLTLGRALWYPLAAERARAWALDPLEDQQLAGLLMWVPSGVLFALLGLALFSAWLGDTERRARLRSHALAAAQPLDDTSAPPR